MSLSSQRPQELSELDPRPRFRRALHGLGLLLICLGLLAGCKDKDDEDDDKAVTPLFRLELISAPANTIIGAPITSSVQVGLRDPFGRALPDAITPVTVAVESGPVGAVVSGTVTRAPEGGIAAFHDLMFSATGTYRLSFSANGYETIVSPPFEVFTGDPVQLGFVDLPARTTAGDTMEPVIVDVQDAVAGRVTSATAMVTLRLGRNDPGATLTGTLTRATVEGRATFDDLVLQTAGEFTFVATTAMLDTGVSTPFVIEPGEAASARFATAPGDRVVNARSTPPVTVELLDSFGNVATLSTATVALNITSNPTGARLFGESSRTVTDGRAAFPGFRIARPGNGYELSATVEGVAGGTVLVTSPAFDVREEGPDVLAVNVPGGPLAGVIPVTVTIAQAASERAELQIEFDAGSGFQRISVAPATAGSSGVHGVTTAPAPSGGVHTVLWDSARDLAGRSVNNVTVRVTATLRGLSGATNSVSGLQIENGLTLRAARPFPVGADPRDFAAGDLNGDGRPDLAAVNTSADSLTLLFNDGAGLGAPLSLSTGDEPVAVAIGDLDGDGRADIAVANRADQTVSVIFQDATTRGLFASGSTLTVDAEPSDVVIVDFDRDGLRDLLVANAGGPVGLYRQDPAAPGTFLPVLELRGGLGPVALAITDLDGDAFPDLAIAHRDSGDIALMRQDPANPGLIASTTTLSAAAGLSRLLAVDLDRDGRLDLVSLNATTRELRTWRQDATRGTFTAGVTITVGNGPDQLTAGDLDGDGRPELLVSNGLSGNLTLLPSSASAASGFGPATMLQSAASPSALALADLDRDGRLDLLVGRRSDAMVSLRDNLTPRSIELGFAAARRLLATVRPERLVSADLDADGRADLVHAGGSAELEIHAGRDGGRFASVATPTVGAGTRELAITDFDDDGRPDIVALAEDAGELVLLRGDGAMTFTPAVRLDTGLNAVSFAAGFLDRDGFVDFAVVTADGRVRLYRRDSAESWTEQPSLTPMGSGARAVALGDLDGDLRGDLAVACVGSSTVSIFRGRPDGGRFEETFVKLDGEPVALALADLDGDERPELITAERSADAVVVRSQDPASPGAFLSGDVLTGTGAPTSLLVQDLDGDGRPDLLVTADDGRATVFINDPGAPGTFLAPDSVLLGAPASAAVLLNHDGDDELDAAFALPDSSRLLVSAPGATGADGFAASSAVGATPSAVSHGDIDGDGLQDLVAACESDGSLRVFLGLGAGQVSADPRITVAAGAPRDVKVADINRDGRADLISLNATARTIEVRGQDASSPGSFLAPVSIATADGPTALTVADVNGDGLPDVAVCEAAADQVSVFLQDAAAPGTFLAATVVSVGAGPSALVVADVDSNGRADLITAGRDASALSVALQDTAGTFGTPRAVDLGAGATPSTLATLDFDRDGRLDLAVGLAGTDQVVVLLQDPQNGGLFGAARALETGADVVALGVVSGPRGAGLVALAGGELLTITSSADGTALTVGARHQAGADGNGLTVTDLDGDGRTDVAVSDGTDQRLLVLLTR